MNCFRILLAFLATSFAFAAIYSEEADYDPLAFDIRRIQEILLVEDNPVALAGLFARWPEMPISFKLWPLFHVIIKFGRTESFQRLINGLPNMLLQPKHFTVLLHLSFCYDRLEYANAVAALNPEGSRDESMALWLPRTGTPANLSTLKQFITDHPGLIDALTPTQADFKEIKSVENAIALLELARHCATVEGGRAVDLGEFLEHTLRLAKLGEVEMAQVTLRLLHEGAEVKQQHHASLNSRSRAYEDTKELLRNWYPEDIKEPEEAVLQIQD